MSPRERSSDLVSLVTTGSLEDWRRDLINDFEDSVFPSFPAIENLKVALYDRGARYACMSGSGSSVFGVFDSEDEAARANEAILSSNPSYRSWAGPA